MSPQWQQAIGWFGIFLLLIVLTRAFAGKFITRYPAFYLYIAYVTLSSGLALYIVHFLPGWYRNYYWFSEFISLLLGLGVTLECFRDVMPTTSGLRHFANIVLAALCILASLRLLAEGIPKLSQTVIELERDLRSIQVLMFAWFAFLVLYYGISISSNIFGIALGYALFLSTMLFNLAIRANIGPSFLRKWESLQPIEYLVCELLWCLFLWSYSPPIRARESRIVSYDVASNQLTGSLHRLQSYLSEILLR